eukprot:gene5514-biopygen4591
MFLHGGPARAAKFPGPAKAEPAFFAQYLGPALHIVAREFQCVVHLVGNVGGQVCADPGANLFAERLLFGGECQIHGEGLQLAHLQKYYGRYGFVPVDLGHRHEAVAHLQKYYGRYGFVPVTEVYLEDDIPHIGMRKAAV